MELKPVTGFKAALDERGILVSTGIRTTLGNAPPLKSDKSVTQKMHHCLP